MTVKLTLDLNRNTSREASLEIKSSFLANKYGEYRPINLSEDQVNKLVEEILPFMRYKSYMFGKKLMGKDLSEPDILFVEEGVKRFIREMIIRHDNHNADINMPVPNKDRLKDYVSIRFDQMEMETFQGDPSEIGVNKKRIKNALNTAFGKEDKNTQDE